MVNLLSATTGQIRDTLLRFCSSELTSHASNIIGLSIILFAYFGVVGQLFKERIPFQLCDVPLTWESLRYVIVFLILSVIIAFIFFAGMRLVYYGKLAEYWNVTDNVNIFRHIGAIEITETGKKLFPEDETQT
jgi:hypothetical protein